MSNRCEICETTIPITSNWCPCCDNQIQETHEGLAANTIIL